jgi:hypothetical protein
MEQQHPSFLRAIQEASQPIAQPINKDAGPAPGLAKGGETAAVRQVSPEEV